MFRTYIHTTRGLVFDFLAAPQVSAAIITASVALLVGVAAAVLTPAVASLRARRQAIHDRFDAALAGLLLVQAARWSPTGMREAPGGRTPEEHRALDLRMNEKGIEFYVERTALARLRLIPARDGRPAIIPRPGPLQARLLDLLDVDPTRPP